MLFLSTVFIFGTLVSYSLHRTISLLSFAFAPVHMSLRWSIKRERERKKNSQLLESQLPVDGDTWVHCQNVAKTLCVPLSRQVQVSCITITLDLLFSIVNTYLVFSLFRRNFLIAVYKFLHFHSLNFFQSVCSCLCMCVCVHFVVIFFSSNRFIVRVWIINLDDCASIVTCVDRHKQQNNVLTYHVLSK